MKLRLPHKLQAALIATFASVSLTTLSTGTAYATTLEDAALGLDDFTQASVDAAKAEGWSFGDTGIATASGVYTTTVASSTITSSTPWTTTASGGRAVYAALMTIDVSSLSTNGGVLLTSTKDDGTAREGIGYDYTSGTYKVESAWAGAKRDAGLINQNLMNYADANGLVTVAIIYKGNQGNGGQGGATIFVANQTKNDTGLKGDDNTSGNPKMLLANTTGVKYTNLYMFGMTDGNSITDADMQSMMKEAAAYYWKGSTDGSWDGTTKNWRHYGSDLAVSIGRGTVDDMEVVGNTNTNVVFGADAATKSVTVDDLTYTGAMTVNDNYTFNMEGGANLTVAGNLAGTGDITLSGWGTLTVAGGASGDEYVDVIVNEGTTVELQGKTGTDYKLRYTLAGGTLSNMGGATSNENIQNDQITLTQDSRVRVLANFYMLASGYGVSYLNLNGNTLQKSGANTFTLYNTHVSEGTLDIEGGMVDFSTNKATPEVAANITLHGGNITGGIKYTADTTLKALQTVSSNVQLELNGHKLTTEVAGGQTLTLSGNISGNGSLVKTGAGTLSLSGDNTITQTIDLQQGNLYFVSADVTVNANDIANFQAVEGSTSKYSQGDNGYLTSSAKYYLVKGAEGTTAFASVESFTGGTLDDPQPSSEDVVFTFNLPTDKVYYVNTQVAYGDADADAVAATSFVINKGATLTAANSSAYGTAKVLHGEGTYALANSQTALNGGLSLGNDWRGTVRLTSASANNLNFANLVQGSQSTIEFAGYTGYSNNWNGTNTQNIRLTTPDGGGVAWNATGAATRNDNNTAIYSGTWSGDGTMTIAPNKLNYTFSGDISQWTGKLETVSTYSNTFNLTFTGNATAINAEIAGKHSTNQMNLVVDTDATFSKNVAANKLTVNEGKSATFTSTSTLTTDNVTGAGNVNLDNTTLTLDAASKYSGFTGTITADGANAKLVFNAADSFGGKLAQANGGTIEMYGTAAVVADSASRIEVVKKTNQSLTLKEGSGQSIAKVTMVDGNSTWLFAQAIGENEAGLYTDIDLAATSGSNKGLIIENGSITANIGSLSGVSGTEVRGDYNSGGNRVLVVHQNDNTTFAGTFLLCSSDRSVALTKKGTGTLTLTGANKSDHALTVNEGTVAFGGSGDWAGAIAVNAGGTLELTTTSTGLTGAVTVNEDGTLKLSASGDEAATFTNLTLADGSTVDLTSLGLDGVDTTPVVLAHGGTIAEAGLAGVTVNLGASVGRQGQLGVQNSNLVLTYQNADLIWDNAGSDGVWNTTSKNWHTAGHVDTHLAFMSGDNVAFNESTTVSLAAATTAGTVSVAAGQKLDLTSGSYSLTAAALSLEDNSEVVFKCTGDVRSHTLGDVQVSGTGKVNTFTGQYSAAFTISDLDGDEDSVLELHTTAQVRQRTTYTLTGNKDDDFQGKVVLSQDQTNSGGQRRLALNINAGAADLLKTSEIYLTSVNNTNSFVGLGVNAENVTVKGINSNDDPTAQYLVFSGAADNADADFSSEEVYRTLTLDTAGDDFTTSAKILGYINLQKEGDGSQKFNGDLSAMNGTVTVKKGTLTLSNANTDTAASLGELAVNGGSLVLGGNIGFSSMNITGGTAVVEDSGNVTYTGSEAIANSGTFTLNSNVYTTNLAVASSNFNVGLNGQEISTDVTNANYFAGGRRSTLTLVSGGIVIPNGHKVVQDNVEYTLGADGTASSNTAADYSTFYQHEAGSTLTLSAINAAAVGQTFGVGKVDVQGANLTIDAMCWDVVAYNARLVVEDAEYVIAAHIAGGTNNVIVQGAEALDLPKIMFNQSEAAKVVNLKHADGSDYTVTDNTNASVRITSLEDDALRNGQVTITAAANAPTSYAVSSDAFGVNATKLEKIADSRVQVNNTLNVKEIHNDAAGKTGDFVLTRGVDAAALDTVIATSGNIEFQNMSETEQANLNTLNIGEGMAVSMYTGSVADAAHEASVTVTGTLTAGRGATLNANLEMASGSTLDVSASNGVNGLLMGSSVTLNEGMNLADYTGEWSTWVDGTKYALFTGVDGLDIGSGTGTAAIDYTQWVDASNYFTNITEQNRYFLCYDGAPTANAEAVLTAVGNNGSNVGMVYIMVMPEPTTSTLSLLALAALAARRRKHN